MISPLAHVDPAARIGNDVTIHPFAFVDADTEIGDGCSIMPYASVLKGTTLGKNIKVYQGAIVGADPQDFRWKGAPSRCSVGDGSVIREHVIINRGFADPNGTRIGPNCFIMADLLKGGTRVSANVPPFVIMAHNPVSYYGVNSVVMGKHGGFSDEQIDDVAKAYRHLYQTSTSIFNALQRIEADIAPSEIRDEIVNFVRYYGKPLAGHRVDLDD